MKRRLCEVLLVGTVNVVMTAKQRRDYAYGCFLFLHDGRRGRDSSCMEFNNTAYIVL
jgi:hypothetical protein